MADAGGTRSGGRVVAGVQADRLADRYGRRPRSAGRRRVLVAAALVALLGAVAWSAWVASSTGRRPVRWQSVGYTVQADTATLVRFDVTTRDGAAAVCTVEALNASRTTVGLLDVTVPAADAATRRATATVPTSERAVTGGVRACALAR